MADQFLIVVDMQKDFVDGALGSPEAVAVVPAVCEKIRAFDGDVIVTYDTHAADYLHTAEGVKLPVPHCIKDTDGWQIRAELDALRRTEAIDKLTFGSSVLVDVLKAEKDIESITFVGLCTDICVISNAIMIKNYFPSVKVTVDASCCAGVTPEKHTAALEVMKSCQIDVIGE